MHRRDLAGVVQQQPGGPEVGRQVVAAVLEDVRHPAVEDQHAVARLRHAAFSLARSSSLSSRSAAAAESRIDCGRLAPGIGMTTGDWASSQASATCCGLTPLLGGHLGEGRVVIGERLGVAQPAERAPREERQAELGAHVDLGTAAAEGRRELVLHAHQPVADHLVRQPDLIGVGVRDADPRDLAGVLDLLEGADDLFVRHLRIGPVVLPERDLLDAQPLAGWRRRPRAGGPRSCPGPTLRPRCERAHPWSPAPPRRGGRARRAGRR